MNTVCTGKTDRGKAPEDTSNLAVLPFDHAASRHINNVALKFRAAVVFRNGFKQVRLTPFSEGTAQEGDIKHKDKAIGCRRGRRILGSYDLRFPPHRRN